MRTQLGRPRALWWSALGLGGLLVLLAVLQYRWIGEVSEAERERLQVSMQSSAQRLARDFNRELTRALLVFSSGSGTVNRDDLTGRYEHWSASALYPELVSQVLSVHGIAEDRLLLSRWNSTAEQWIPTLWPPDLEDLRRSLQARSDEPHDRATRRGFPSPFVPLAATVPALVIPQNVRGRGRLGPGQRAHRRAHADFLILRLDLETIRAEVLPELAARHFGNGEEIPFELQVRDASTPQVEIWSHHSHHVSDTSDIVEPPDVTVGFFGILPFDHLRREGLGRPPGPDRSFPGMRSVAGSPKDRWILSVTHPGGGLATAVAGTRRRNLALGLGILGVLGTAMLLMVLASRKVQILAHQQLEFVAGVTHELHTPLSAIRAAGQNLADGVVSESDQVKRYGAMIEQEGGRLTHMVAQILDFAGMQHGRAEGERASITVNTLIDQALKERQPELSEGPVEVAIDLPHNLPAVEGDVVLLRKALGNLISNAVKYGDGAWLGISGRGRRQTDAAVTPQVEISVSDNGPGIAASDAPHLFEPFFRGKGVAAGTTPGSGLGLSLVRNIVEAHDGTVRMEARQPRGSTFTITLPAKEVS